MPGRRTLVVVAHAAGGNAAIIKGTKLDGERTAIPSPYEKVRAADEQA